MNTNGTTSCVIYFNEQSTMFINEFVSTLGQVFAVAFSSLTLLPVYNYCMKHLKMA